MEAFINEKRFEKNKFDDNIQIIEFLASEFAAYRMECRRDLHKRLFVNFYCHFSVT
jgi:hypothetical protein